MTVFNDGRRSTALLTVPLVCVSLSACLDGGSPLDAELQDCIRPSIDTTSWVRTEGAVNILLPPEFEAIAANRWERGGTRIRLDVVISGEEPVIPFPEWNYAGSCQAQINGRRVVIDYGGVSSGGPTPDLGIAASWRSVPLPAASGDVILSAQARDHSDAVVVEAAIWSIVISSGPPTL